MTLSPGWVPEKRPHFLFPSVCFRVKVEGAYAEGPEDLRT